MFVPNCIRGLAIAKAEFWIRSRLLYYFEDKMRSTFKRETDRHRDREIKSRGEKENEEREAVRQPDKILWVWKPDIRVGKKRNGYEQYHQYSNVFLVLSPCRLNGNAGWTSLTLQESGDAGDVFLQKASLSSRFIGAAGCKGKREKSITQPAVNLYHFRTLKRENKGNKEIKERSEREK